MPTTVVLGPTLEPALGPSELTATTMASAGMLEPTTTTTTIVVSLYGMVELSIPDPADFCSSSEANAILIQGISEIALVPAANVTTRCIVVSTFGNMAGSSHRRLKGVARWSYSLLMNPLYLSVAAERLGKMDKRSLTDVTNARLGEAGLVASIEVVATFGPLEAAGVTPSDAWTMSGWSACSKDCGWGTRTRNVSCGGGMDMLCLAWGEKPPQEERCNDWCPFDVMCPLGSQEIFGCDSQKAFMAVTFSLVATCVGCCILCCIVRCCRSPQGNRYITIRGLVRRTCETSTSTSTTTTTLQVSANIVRSLSKDIAVAVVGKKHFLRDTYDMDTPLSVEPFDSSVQSAPSDESGQWVAVEFLVSSEDATRCTHPAYLDGSEVEYFSSTHATWRPGIIELVRLSRERIQYNVMLRDGDVRLDVVLDELRPPLVPNEPLEIFCGNVGWTTCALGASMVQRDSSFLGYRVAMEDGLVVELVPADRLRRLFSPSDLVYAYLGLNIGFVSCSVKRSATASEDLKLGVDEIDELERIGRAEVASPRLQQSGLREYVSDYLHSSHFHDGRCPWTWVLASFEQRQFSSFEKSSWVPSFLLFRPPRSNFKISYL